MSSKPGAGQSRIPELSAILDFSKFFWAEMERLAELLSRFVKRMMDAQVQARMFDYARVRSRIDEFLRSEEYKSSIVRRFSGMEVSLKELEKMRGTRLFVDVFSEYVLEKMDHYANIDSAGFGLEPRFKRGDMADLSHVFYCPYVDIFGCDAAMRDRIKRAGRLTKNIVTNDAELQSKIAELSQVSEAEVL